MNYTELGYDKFLNKNQYTPDATELSEDESSQRIPNITGTSITGGVATSPDGRMKIDWNRGQIIIGDGAYNRVLIGFDIN